MTVFWPVMMSTVAIMPEMISKRFSSEPRWFLSVRT